jgi:hypothetical protein
MWALVENYVILSAIFLVNRWAYHLPNLDLASVEAAVRFGIVLT